MTTDDGAATPATWQNASGPAGPADTTGENAETSPGIDQSTVVNWAGRDQYSAGRDVNVTVHYEARSGSDRVRRSILVPDARRDQAAVVVPPDGLDDAGAILAAEHVVVLASQHDAGYEAASIYLVDKLISTSNGLLDGLSVELVADDRDFTLDAALSDWERGTALIVDLVDPQSDVDVVLADLGGFQRKLTTIQSYLVLAVPERCYERFRGRYPGWVHRLARAGGPEVFRRHIRGVPESIVDDVLRDDWLTGQLREVWPPQAARLAQLAQAAHAAGLADAATLAQEIRAAYEDWTSKLREEFQDHPDAWWRSLLMAAAVLEGTDSPPVVVTAAESFLDNTNYLREPEHPLVGPGVSTRLETLKETTLDPASITFSRPEYGRSVLPHVWADHPDLRDHLLRWIVALPTTVAELDSQDLDNLADRAVDLAIRRGHGIATTLARSWATSPRRDDGRAGTEPAGDPASRTRRSLAVRVLAAAAADHTIGREVREQLYRWAYADARRWPELELVVAQVCGSLFGAAYPRNALTRLKHLTKSNSTAVRAAVADAIHHLGVHIGPLRLLGHLTTWLDNANPARLAVLAQGFDKLLADPTVLRNLAQALDRMPRHGNPNALRQFWQQLYDAANPNDLTHPVMTWLAAAAQLECRHGDAMVELLVSATGDEVRHYGDLVYATRGPARTATDERVTQLYAQVRTRLDETNPLPRDEGEVRGDDDGD